MINTEESNLINSSPSIQKTSLECPSCGNEFNKIHKPLILKCSHNICQVCQSLNKNKIICFTCKSKYEDKEARRFPINFLLLEIIEGESSKKDNKEKEKEKEKISKGKKGKKNSSKNTENSLEKTNSTHTIKDVDENMPKITNFYKCLECDLKFPNNYHFTISHPTHTISTEENLLNENGGKEYLIQKSDDLMKCYKNYNEKLDKNNENFFIYLTDMFSKNNSLLKEELKKSDPLDNLLSLGLINTSDKERTKEYFEKFLKNEKIRNILKDSNTFEEMIKSLSLHKEIKIHQFLSAYFYYEEIIEKKLNIKNIEQKVKIIKENMLNLQPKNEIEKNSLQNNEFSHSLQKNEKNEKNEFSLQTIDPLKFSSLMKSFTQDISVEVYNGLNLEQDLNKNLKLPHVLTNNNSLIIFDPMLESIKTFLNIVNKFFPSEFSTLTKFNLHLNSNYTIFISGGLLSNKISLPNVFSINLNNNEVKNYSNMTEGRHGHSSIIVNNKLFILGGFTQNLDGEENLVKTFERFNINQNSWTKLSTTPLEIKNGKPNLLNFEDEYLYIFENLINFFYYHIKNDKWTHCKPKYKGSYHLEIENFSAFYYNSNVIILGGLNQGVMENYEKSLNENIYYLEDGESLISKKGEFKMSDFVCRIDHGFMIDVHYLIEWSEEKQSVEVFSAKEKDKEIYKWNSVIKQEIKEY